MLAKEAKVDLPRSGVTKRLLYCAGCGRLTYPDGQLVQNRLDTFQRRRSAKEPHVSLVSDRLRRVSLVVREPRNHEGLQRQFADVLVAFPDAEFVRLARPGTDPPENQLVVSFADVLEDEPALLVSRVNAVIVKGELHALNGLLFNYHCSRHGHLRREEPLFCLAETAREQRDDYCDEDGYDNGIDDLSPPSRTTLTCVRLRFART